MASQDFVIDRVDDVNDLNAYISNGAMQSLGIPEGSIISVRNKLNNQTLVAIHGSDIPDNTIKLSRCHRLNLCSCLGESVKISKPIKSQQAEVVVAAPIDDTVNGLSGNFGDLIHESGYNFNNFPVYPNFTFPVYTMQRVVEFQVIKCSPAGAHVIVNSSDVFSIRSQPIPRSSQLHFNVTSYDDIGGIDGPLQRVRNAIERPLLSPEYATRREPKTVLITAPAGCGKTLVASAITNETSAEVLGMKGSDVISIRLESAVNLIKSAMNSAMQKSPCIIFIDDIDIISCQQYNEDGTPNNTLSNAIGQFVQAFQSQQQRVLIATARHPETIVPQVAQLFQEKIAITYPTEEQKLKIAEAITRKMEICGESALQELCNGSETGSDIEMKAQNQLTEKMMNLISKVDPLAPAIPLKVLQEVAIGDGNAESRKSYKNRAAKTQEKKQKKKHAQHVEETPSSSAMDPFGDIGDDDENVEALLTTKTVPIKSTGSFHEPTNFEDAKSPDPFAAQSDPFAAPPKKEAPKKEQDDPFAAPKSAPMSGDPFAIPSTPMSSDPFAAISSTKNLDSMPMPGADPFASGPFVVKSEKPKPSPLDPFGGEEPKSQNSGDPFAAPSSDPFAAPPKNAKKESVDPFAAPPAAKSTPPKGSADPFAAPADDPFAAPPKKSPQASADPFAAGDDPFSAPKAAQKPTPKTADPFAAPNDDPFSAPKAPAKKTADPFAAPEPEKAAEDPFAAPSKKGSAPASTDPFAMPAEDPFAAPKAASKAAPKNDPFAAPSNDDPFAAPKAPAKKDADPFAPPAGVSADDPFSAPKKAAPADDPFGAPKKAQAEDPFSAPKKQAADPFSAPKKQAEDPFSAPKKQTADPFSAPKKQAEDPFASKPKKSAEDPFSAPKKQAEDPFASKPKKQADDPFASKPKKQADDPFSAPAPKKAPVNADNDPFCTMASDPFGEGVQKNTYDDPFASATKKLNPQPEEPKPAAASDPFAPKKDSKPATEPRRPAKDPFASSGVTQEPVGNDPFAPKRAPAKDPFASGDTKTDNSKNVKIERPEKKAVGDPFAASNDDPFTHRSSNLDAIHMQDDPFSQKKDKKQAKSNDDPFAAPAKAPPQSTSDPFAAPKKQAEDPFSQPSKKKAADDPFSKNANDPFSTPAADDNDPFSAPPPKMPSNDPFAVPAAGFGTPAGADPFAPPASSSDPFGASAFGARAKPSNDPFAATPMKESQDPFASRKK